MRTLEMWLGNIYKYKVLIRVMLSVAYVFIILYLTLLTRNPCDSRAFTGLFWEIRHQYWGDITQNILLFIPLGLCLSVFRFGIAIGVSLSVVIEIFQYYFKFGLCQIDDIVNNLIGLVIGLIIARTMSVIYQNIKSFHKK